MDINNNHEHAVVVPHESQRAGNDSLFLWPRIVQFGRLIGNSMVMALFICFACVSDGTCYSFFPHGSFERPRYVISGH